MMKRAASCLLLASAALAVPRTGHAWEQIYFGVDYQQWTTPNTSGHDVECYALRFDTTQLEAVHLNGATAFWMTPESWAYPGGTMLPHTTSEFAQTWGLDVAINGNKWTDVGSICAYAVGGVDYDIAAGHQYAWVQGENGWPGCAGSMLVFGARNAGDHPDSPHIEYWYEYAASVIGHFPWAVNAIQDDPPLLWDGELFSPTEVDGEAPRTCVGLSADNRLLYWFVTDSGYWGVRDGMYFSRARDVMLELGAHNAFCVDGGGSSTMYLAARGGVVSAPTDAAGERPVLNHQGAVIPKLNVEWVSDGIPESMKPGAQVDVTLEARNPFGPWSWGDDASHPDNLALYEDSGAQTAQFAVSGDWLSDNRIRTVTAAVAPYASWTFEFPIQAPTTPGTYSLALHMVRDGVTWYGGKVFRAEIQVGAADDAGVEPSDAAADAGSDAASTFDGGPALSTAEDDGGCGCGLWRANTRFPPSAALVFLGASLSLLRGSRRAAASHRHWRRRGRRRLEP